MLHKYVFNLIDLFFIFSKNVTLYQQINTAVHVHYLQLLYSYFFFHNKNPYLFNDFNNVTPARRCSPKPGPISNADFNVTKRIHDVDQLGRYFGGTIIEWQCDSGWTMTPDSFYGQVCGPGYWKSLYRDNDARNGSQAVGRCVRGKNLEAFCVVVRSIFQNSFKYLF